MTGAARRRAAVAELAPPDPLAALGIPPGGLRLELPEPPTVNAMLELAKQRTVRTRGGGFRRDRKALPLVYDQALEAYELRALVALRERGQFPPRVPWPTWHIVAAHFRVYALRDWVELSASLKWPVDVLVRGGYVADDSPAELALPPAPSQLVERRDAFRGVSLIIAPGWPPDYVPPDPRAASTIAAEALALEALAAGTPAPRRTRRRASATPAAAAPALPEGVPC